MLASTGRVVRPCVTEQDSVQGSVSLSASFPLLAPTPRTRAPTRRTQARPAVAQRINALRAPRLVAVRPLASAAGVQTQGEGTGE